MIERNRNNKLGKLIKITTCCVLVLGVMMPGREAQAWRLRFPKIKIRIFSRRNIRKSHDRKKENSRQTQRQLKYRRINQRRDLSRREIEILISHYSRRHRLDPHFVKAVVKVESNFNPRCRSKAGAMGLMQLMPGTARELGVRNPWDPEENIAGGVKYLAKMRKRFKDMKLVLAAYNAGPGNVSRYDGVPPFAETQRYIKKVMTAYQGYQKEG